MKNFFIVFFAIINILFAQSAELPSGGGTEGSPYQIETIGNLYWITQDNSRLSLYYVQVNDVDASGTATWYDNGAGGYYGWQPIGSSSNPFTGSYNGQGFAISGLTISRGNSNSIGLFGYASGATISNLHLTSVNITGYDYTGALVGFNNASQINNCSSGGAVHSTYLSCGGLVGYNTNSSIISESYSTCTVSGGYYTGGLVGQCLSSAQITKCYASGNVSAGFDYAGGLIGINHGCNISDSYSLGDVIKSGGSNFNFAGFIGSNDGGAIEDCYSTGKLYISVNDKGFAGSNSNGGTIQNCFWDTETSEQPYSNGGIGKITDDMKTASTFTDAGWDFSAGTGVWEMVGTNYPRLQDNPDPALPIELVSFSAAILNNSVELNWQTATEVNNYGFNVECTIDNTKWDVIGFVQGHGTTNSPKEYSFSDTLDLTLNLTQASYRLKQIDNDGTFAYSKGVTVDLTSITSVDDIVQYTFALEQNYPNPFNPSTTIVFTVPTSPSPSPYQGEGDRVRLVVYNILGREVATLVNQKLQPGNHEAKFDASNLSSGIYFYRINIGEEYNSIKKMILIK